MKRKLTFLIILLKFIPAHSQIVFEHGSWNELKAKAKQEHKLIFMDAYTTWCGPCKWMAKNVFTNDTVARYFNTHFINAKFDMEAGEGKELATAYSVHAFPSLIFIDAEGALVHKSIGSRDSKAFIQLAEDAQNPEKQYASIEKQYKNGNKNYSNLSRYLKASEDAGVSTDELLNAYLDTQKEEDLLKRDNWNLLCTYEKTYDAKAFKYVLANSDKFSAHYPSDSVTKFIFQVIQNCAGNMIFSRKKDVLNNYLVLKNTLSLSSYPKKEELLLMTDMDYYEVKKDTTNYTSTAISLIEKYKNNDAMYLNYAAWGFYEKVKDKALLVKAEGWAKKAVELDPTSAPADTYARLLFVNGKNKEAITMEEKAVKLEKESKEADAKRILDYEEQIALFKKVNN